MNYLSVDKISKSFGARVLFQDISFGIEQGQKVALVGVNGSGKSTLLKILAGLDVPDTGEVVVANDVKVTFLNQQPEFDNSLSVIEAVLDSDEPVAKLVKEYEHLLVKSATDPSATDQLTTLITRMDELDAWNYESQVKEILGRLGIHDQQQNIDSLSGGQKKRVGLAKTLLEKPDLVILDEPTNHLDLEAIEWLEEYLSQSQMGIIMVTHDRYFLESVTNEIIELDQSQIFKYSGNYSYFLEKKAEREQNQQAEKEKAKNLYGKELDWIRRQPKARGTKAKYRIDAFEDIKKKAHQNLEKQQLELEVKGRRQGGKILEIDSISKSFGEKELFKHFSYIFKRGERVGIVGKNGTGKSTFLNTLTGSIKPDEGEIVKGATTAIGYYKQKEPEFKSGSKVIDVVQEIAEVITMADGSTVTASRFLTLFNFAPAAQHDFVDKLSGGEKRRLQLLCVLVQNPNFLILDEPTNDLDLITLRTLEDFLSQFQGCLIIVSHDRYFMDRLVDHLFVFDKTNEIQDFPGNYSVYREYAKAKEEAEKAEVTKVEAEPKTVKVKTDEGRKMSYNEKREFDTLEKDIEKLNKKKEELHELMNSGEQDHVKLNDWGAELKAIENELDEKEMRWLELSELS
ncbi:ABC-F family ATP-binding cassette domain-containing protein [Fulvivirga maritima]|uniref:ABC-F family ATP-binding cassette domain-containing protein n=1 Tax=Fulvivirga maritima TaxID=2904247 RepID=UPI001F21F5D5|nr:ABC-F family ATP-binding cassette domain-containing protein [Fulvivirga maritima]UII27106.1 ABC-F family ATP-binding cassette domain-containing protein [Fulvivirga maritima]